MDDGQPCPDRHDGMAVVGVRPSTPRPGAAAAATDMAWRCVLIRNHERGAGTPIRAPGMYDTGTVSGAERARRRHHDPGLAPWRMDAHRSRAWAARW